MPAGFRDAVQPQRWKAGRRDKALDIFSKIVLFDTQATTHGFQTLRLT